MSDQSDPLYVTYFSGLRDQLLIQIFAGRLGRGRKAGRACLCEFG